jgi:predicted amidophosphoribosyltransferase
VVRDGRIADEGDVAVCAHCQAVVAVRAKDGVGWCARCAAPVCPRCEAAAVCRPFERRLERLEARDRFLRSAGLA